MTMRTLAQNENIDAIIEMGRVIISNLAFEVGEIFETAGREVPEADAADLARCLMEISKATTANVQKVENGTEVDSADFQIELMNICNEYVAKHPEYSEM